MHITVAMKENIQKFILSVLKWYAYWILKIKKPIIVGVTGSAGKTSCIYLIDSLTKDTWSVKTTFQGNSETGLPLEIMDMRSMLHSYNIINWISILIVSPFHFILTLIKPYYSLLIAEMGIDSSKKPKNMDYLLEFIKPDIGVFLNVSTVHGKQFIEELNLPHDPTLVMKKIAEEKGKIITTLQPTAYAVVNGDYPDIITLAKQSQAKIITFGSTKTSDYALTSHQITSEQTSFQFFIHGKSYSLAIPNYLLSREYGLTILASIAVSGILRIPIETCLTLIRTKLTLPPGRSSLLRGKNNTRILDSSYNSSPVALTSLLKSLNPRSIKKRIVLILGDMRELGELAIEEHEKLAPLIASLTDTVILVGPLMKQYLAPKLQELLVTPYVFSHAKGVGDILLEKNILKKNDLIVVKGSQNTIFLEQIVYELLFDQSEASKLLCRQSDYWKQTRNNFFASQPD